MEREYYNESDENEDEEMNDFVQTNKQDILEIMHLELIEQKNNAKLADQAREIVSKEWLWRFRTPKYKFKAIQNMYNKLKKLVVDE